MSATSLDPSIFRHIGFESTRLTRLVQIVHSLDKPGRRRLHATRNGDSVAHIDFDVVDDPGAVTGLHIDLSDLAGCACDPCGSPHRIRAGGHIVVHVGHGIDAWGAEVFVEGGECEWSSHHLSPGDLVAATVLRPGTYRLVNGAAEGKVTVAYPKVLDGRYRPGDPTRVRSNGATIAPARVTMGPASAIVVEVRKGGTVQLELVKADDRRPKRARPAHRSQSA
jgi:hypothetical protein